ncbi:Uncharacterised protein [Acinetobacter johnsonii]|uniref:Uncharacterized protein n=1 Tax=Acinetobacter johnsonii TaxID=40214 RepID=A0A380U9I8_ACIJO|nr:hypothetical protein F986_03033 [Acinetobacter johnsonii CIP 64.6]SUT98861.1 Uncharacterised protein [Acinetobacter johnsonii]
MLFSVFYVGDSCQGWGREFESRFPLQIQKALIEILGLFYLTILQIHLHSDSKKGTVHIVAQYLFINYTFTV